MGRFDYVAVLVLVLAGTGWLELLLRTRVYARPRRLVLTLVPVVAVFCLWDLFAIASGHWTFDVERTLGVVFPGGLPLDEVLFFVVVPIAALLTLEAVRAVKRWEVGDEAPGECVDGMRSDEVGRAGVRGSDEDDS
jgi:lycopene cyclase domain-containing protein